MRSNCLIFAVLLYRRRMRRWRARGSPIGYEPRIESRQSRLAPLKVPHYLYCEKCHYGLREVSYIPLDHRPLRWWQVWRVILFTGRVRRGD